jgi:hypothetical protein
MRLLSNRDFTSRDLWRKAKPVVRLVETDCGVLIFDDTIQEKEWTDENERMCWHRDHVGGCDAPGSEEVYPAND